MEAIENSYKSLTDGLNQFTYKSIGIKLIQFINLRVLIDTTPRFRGIN